VTGLNLNRAFYIIGIPAFIVSFLWIYYGYGLKVAVAVILAELIAAIGGVIYLRRKVAQSRPGGQAANR
jgi:hypothetical protein